MEYLLGLIVLAGIAVTWFIMGLVNDRARKAELEQEALYESIKAQQAREVRLRSDDEYRKRVRDTFND